MDTKTMTPEVFAQAIVSIERNYGLRLDARSTWLRLDEFKKVKELAGGKCNEGKGWYGLKGACKRGKKGEGEARSKESKVDIAGRIRKRKMGESAGKVKPKVTETSKEVRAKMPAAAKEVKASAPAKEPSVKGLDPNAFKRGDVLDIKASKKAPAVPYEYHSTVNGVMKFIGRDDRSKFTTLEKSDVKDLEGYGLLASGMKRKEKDTKDKENGFTPQLTTFSAIGDKDILKWSNSGIAKNNGEVYDYMGRDKENNLILMGTKGHDAGIRIMTNNELMEHIKEKQVKVNT